MGIQEMQNLQDRNPDLGVRDLFKTTSFFELIEAIVLGECARVKSFP